MMILLANNNTRQKFSMLVIVVKNKDIEPINITELDIQKLTNQAEKYTINPTPNPKIRFIGFFLILVGGALGGLTGFAVSRILTTSILIQYASIVFSAIFVSFGVGIIVSLGLQAKIEWKESEEIQSISD